MPESRIQTNSRTTLQTTSRPRGARETSSRHSEVLDGHDMVVTTFHLLSDGLVGARPTVEPPVADDAIIEDMAARSSTRNAVSPVIEHRYADTSRSCS